MGRLLFYIKRLFKLVIIAICIMGGIFLVSLMGGILGFGAGRVAGSLAWLLEVFVFISIFVWIGKKMDKIKEKEGKELK